MLFSLVLAAFLAQSVAQYLPLDNDYLFGKSINPFACGSTFSFVTDAIELTHGDCIRPYNGNQRIVPDELCSSYSGAQDTAVHFGFFHGHTMEDLSVYYSQNIEMDLSISLIGGASVDLFQAGAFQASLESQFSYQQFQTKGINAFIGTARTSCYSVRFSDLYPMKPSYEFKKRIQSAPLKYDSAWYVAAIKNGTGLHIITSAEFGGAFNELAFAGEETVATSFSSEQDLEISCEANMWYTSCSYTDEEQLSASSKDYLHIMGANYNNHYIGKAPHSSDEKQYNTDVCSDPQPSRVQLTPIPYLLTAPEAPEQFGLSAEDLFTIASNFIQGANDYCTMETCYRTPKPVDPVWEEEVTVSSGKTAQLMKANESVCVLTQVKSTSFDFCDLYIKNGTPGDVNYYWYITASNDAATVCSARCSSKVTWASMVGAETNDKIASSFHSYSIAKPKGTKGTFVLPLTSTVDSFCIVGRVENEVGCGDSCRAYPEEGVWKLMLDTGNPWDKDHQDINGANRRCDALCLDVKTPPKELMAAQVDSTMAMKPLTLANESVCVCEMIQGVCSTGERGKGGSIHLKIQEIPGAEGQWWTAEGTTASGTDKCHGSCRAVCYALN